MKISIVSGDDWSGIYIDGKLVFQNSELRPSDILKAVGLSCERIYINSSELEEIGELPENLEDVKKYRYR